MEIDCFDRTFIRETECCVRKRFYYVTRFYHFNYFAGFVNILKLLYDSTVLLRIRICYHVMCSL